MALQGDNAAMMPQDVVVATHNAGKVAELREMLAPAGWRLHAAGALGLPAPVENGGTFFANARLKAEGALAALGERSLTREALESVGNAGLAGPGGAAGNGLAEDGLAALRLPWVLSDDSGLEVAALDGAPGVETAHFGGPQVLLEAMRGVPEGARQARFMCVLALARPGREIVFFEGHCDGAIAPDARGKRGFAYDPVFIPEGDTRTFAEMDEVEKNAYSHRGRAMALLLAWVEANRG